MRKCLSTHTGRSECEFKCKCLYGLVLVDK